MKRMIQLVVGTILLVALAAAQGPYRTVTIREIQQVTLDSLKVADQLQIGVPTRWKVQTSPLLKLSGLTLLRDTVEIVAQIVVPPKVIMFTGAGWTMILRDTAKNAGNGQWTNLFCRTGSGGDTTRLYGQGLLGRKVGDVIRVRGYVDEFPSGSPSYYGTMVSATQFVPISMEELIDEGTTVEKPVPLDPGFFYSGTYPGGKIKWTTGEMYEAAYVEFTNLTVTSIVNSNNGTFSAVDQFGNELAMLDVSKYFTTRAHRDTLSTTWRYKTPSVFQVIDTLRGYISSNSGSEEPRGFRICPVFPGDIVYGKFLPGISTHRRNPVIVKSTDSVKISVKAFIQTGAVNKIASVLLKKSLNGGAYTTDTMQLVAPDSFAIALAPMAANTSVNYFIQAFDTSGGMSANASSAFGSAGSDTAKGKFFFTVLDRPLTVWDLQNTPFSNGRSAYLGDTTATVTGIVTADTSDIDLNALGGTPWYIQNGAGPWNGMWVTPVTNDLLMGFQKGDSVSVMGTVQESNEVTRLYAKTATKLGSDKTLPTPTVLPTGNFVSAYGNGAPIAEQHEGTLVRFNNVTVTDVYPTFADQREYLVSDGSGVMLVRIDGKNMYSNIPGDSLVGKTILNVGDRFTYIQGVMWFAFQRYKLVPRSNADFGIRNLVGVDEDLSLHPAEFGLAQNFPNPFNPSTSIQYGLSKSGFVSLKVYNLLGQEVQVLVDQIQSAGRHTAQFNARSLSSGVYLYRLRSDEGVQVRRMVLMK